MQGGGPWRTPVEHQECALYHLFTLLFSGVTCWPSLAKQVPAGFAHSVNGPEEDCCPGAPPFHVTWVPAVGISSSACGNCAAILEVLAQV